MVEYILVTFLDTFWKKSQQVAQIHGGYIVKKIVKETLGFFQKVATGYILIRIVKEPRGFILKVATVYIVIKVVNAF